MTPDEARRLLGGYATGTLTPEERQALFEAALADQALFDELAREQPLKEVLDDPVNRAELLGVMDEPTPDRGRAARSRLRRRWWAFGLTGAGALATAAVTVFLLVNTGQRETSPAEIARVAAPDEAAPRETVPPPAVKPRPEPQPRSAPSKASKPASTPAPRRSAETTAATPMVPQAVTAGAAPPPALLAPRAPKNGPAAAERTARDRIADSSAVAGSGAKAIGSVTDLKAKLRPGAIPEVTAASFLPNGFVLRYSVQRETATAPGAAPEISVETNVPAYVYAFRRTSPDGQWAPLNPGGSSLAAGLASTLPHTAAARNILVIASRLPIPDLAAAGAELTAAVERVRDSVDRSRLTQIASGDSTAMVRTEDGRDARIVVEIPLPRAP